MASHLKRLLTSGAAYQAASLVAAFLALFTLPLYTRYLTPAELGYAETLLTAIILVSILLRFGIGEAFVRFYFDDDDLPSGDGILPPLVHAHCDKYSCRPQSSATSTIKLYCLLRAATVRDPVAIGPGFTPTSTLPPSTRTGYVFTR